MYTPVKLDSNRNITEYANTSYNTHKECLDAARTLFGKSGGLLFNNSKTAIK
jgi:hypothetical protein